MRQKPICLRFAVLAALSVALAACDIAYGVMRSAQLASAPPLECVHDVVASADGVIAVRYKRDTETGTAITVAGLKPNGPNDAFFFEGTKESNIRGVTQLFQDHTGLVEFTDSQLRLNSIPPQKSIDASRPVMQQIELGLSRNCGLPDLPSKISEWCQGVVCKPLP